MSTRSKRAGSLVRLLCSDGSERAPSYVRTAGGTNAACCWSPDAVGSPEDGTKSGLSRGPLCDRSRRAIGNGIEQEADLSTLASGTLCAQRGQAVLVLHTTSLTEGIIVDYCRDLEFLRRGSSAGRHVLRPCM
jgi:hypothetical protein